MSVSSIDDGPSCSYRRADSAADERGRHLVATRSIPKGRLIFAERPLVALQSLDNQQEVKVCHCCKAFIGGPDYALLTRFQINATSSQEEDEEVEQNEIDKNINNDNVDYNPDRNPDYTVVPCRHNCGHAYCSKDCEQDAWHGFHQDLCTGLCESADDPIVVFKQYAAETNEILLLVAEWWVAQHRCSHAEYRQRYTDFTMPYWWDVAVTDTLDQLGGFAQGVQIQESLKQVCDEAASLLNAALGENIPPISSSNISQWIGACEQNSMGIRQRHALCRSVLEDAQVRQRRNQEIIRCLAEAGFMGNGEDGGDDDNCCKEDEESEEGNQPVAEDNGEGTEEEKREMEHDGKKDSDEEQENGNAAEDDASAAAEWDYSVEEIQSFLAGLFIDEDNSVRDAAVSDDRFRDTVGDDLDYIFPPLDGTAMYYTACKMNHSCEPNVIVLYKGRGWGQKHPLTAYCIAYKDIEEGEELTISYIETDDPLDARQKALSNYGFTCKCPKCEAQKHGLHTEDKKEKVADIDNLFGEEDDNDESEAGAEDFRDGNTSTEEKGDSLEAKVQRMDSAVNHSRFGNIPLALHAKVAAFVFRIGKEAASEIDDPAILQLWKYCHDGLEERDFCLCKIGGCDLEEILYSMLRKATLWPSTHYRSLYWCASLCAAVGLSHEGSFLEGLCYLDKAMALGLPRQDALVSAFFTYVEQHGDELVMGPYVNRRRCVIPSFDRPEDQAQLESVGLSQPILYPVIEASSDSMSATEFDDEFVSKSAPVVLRGLASTWKSVELWRHMNKFGGENGHRLVPIEVGSMIQGEMDERLVPLRTFVEEFMTQNVDRFCWSLEDSNTFGKSMGYMAQHPLLRQIPSLGEDIVLRPHFCGPTGPTHVYFWMGSGGTRTPLHFDSYENLFVQVVGVKYIRLYNQSETSRLYVNKSGYGLQGNMSDLDCENEDFDMHPLAKDATFQEVLLKPGDALYIPSRTWHYVRSLTSSVSVNYWF